jgi:ATP-dependent RNA helicase RhlE
VSQRKGRHGLRTGMVPAQPRGRMKEHTLTSFNDLGLSAPILKALASENYVTPTPIQTQAIPTVLAGRDLLGIAQTGTGKTAAFALPIIHRLAAEKRAPMHKGCRVLVLSPTRELATQIAESFRTYSRLVGLNVAVVFGGVGHVPQVRTLARGVDVLVATPGRLMDHLKGRSLDLSGTEVFVLDEADQMLDLGFLPSIRRIVSHLTKNRQNLFFSATMPPEIGKLAEELLRDPARVSVAPAATTVERVEQRVLHVEAGNKRNLLVELLADPAMERTLVFARTKRGADRVARHLVEAGINAAAIHGNKSQSQREHALASFRASKTRVLVATDIAARGIDIDQVTHVVNFELPDVPESYVHRIGRTARAGAQGIAISLCDAEERGQLRDIERLTRQTIPAEDRRLAPDAGPLEATPGTRDKKSNPRGRNRGASGGQGRGARDGRDRGFRGEHRAGGRDGQDRGARDGQSRGARDGQDRGFRSEHHAGARDGQNRGDRDGQSRGARDGRDRGFRSEHHAGARDGQDRGARDGQGRGARDGQDRGFRGEHRAGGRDGQDRGARDGQSRGARDGQDRSARGGHNAGTHAGRNGGTHERDRDRPARRPGPHRGQKHGGPRNNEPRSGHHASGGGNRADSAVAAK